MCGGGEASEGQYVCNDGIWCAVKLALRHRPACAGCRGNT